MSDETKNREYIGYEYKEIEVGASKVSFFMDCYENFGWELDQNVMPYASESHGGYARNSHSRHMIRMKRNRKIINKMELTRLQRNFEACINEIDMMEKSKTSLATVYALVIALIGTAFMAGSVFAVTAQPPMIIACIVLAIPGFSGWILPYFVYRKVERKQTAKVNPYIDAKYDEIYEICEKGNKLLN